MEKSENIFLTKKVIIGLIIFIFAFVLRFLVIQSCPDIQIDEPASFLISTPSNNNRLKEQWNKYNFEPGKEYEIQDFRNILYSVSKEKGALLKDLSLTRKQALDRQNTSLYFMMLRIWDYNLHDFNYTKFLNHARSLNLIFFVLSFFFMFKLLEFIKNDYKFISLGLIVSLLSSASVVHIVLARNYELQTMGFIIVSYVSLILLKKIRENINISIKQVFLYGFAFALLLSSAYFPIIYVGMLLFVFLFAALKNKNYSIILKIIFIYLIMLIITCLICPNYFDFRSQNEHYGTVFTNVLNIFDFNQLVSSLDRIIYFILNDSIYLSILFMCLICGVVDIACGNRKIIDVKQSFIVIVVLSFLWALIVMRIAPYHSIRYIYPAFPIISLIVAYYVYQTRYDILRYAVIGVYIVTIGLKISENSFFMEHYDFYSHLRSEKKTPVVFHDVYDFTISIAAFTKNMDNNTPIIIDKSENIKNKYKYDEYYLITPKKFKSDEYNFDLLSPENFENNIYKVTKTIRENSK